MRSVSCDIGMGAVGHSTEYNAKERKVYWKIKKFNGGTEQTLRTKVITSFTASSVAGHMAELIDDACLRSM